MTKFVLLLGIALPLHAIAQNQTDQYTDDVRSIDAIVDAYYDVISGASTDPWQYDRDAFLHAPNAIITRVLEDGSTEIHSLAEEYIPYLLAPKEDIYEVELGREVTQFGQIAQVWSAYELRTDTAVATGMRGVNSIQLHFDQGRWWITSWLTQNESEENPIPNNLLGKNER